ncbi:MAG: molybdate ABC transporter substrate-binding protein [Phycisphaerales bacterium]|nr:molybdate ABC transporter substrate-binding protein [Phycisphaerales bacterium]
MIPIIPMTAMIMMIMMGCDEEVRPSAVRELKPVMVFVAASAGDVFEDLGARFASTGAGEVVINSAGSSTLGRQIIAGAPVDVFISADRDWARVVQDQIPCVGDAEDLLGNELVMVIPSDDEAGSASISGFDLDAPEPPPSWRRVAIADPSHVPAGRYAREALESLGWWGAISGRVIPASDVRAALRLVELGEVDAGIVYRTDAMMNDSVEIIATVPALLHETIVYPILQFERRPEVDAFIRFLKSDDAGSIFERRGFSVVSNSGEARS